jgi:hypothetical protein
VCASYPGYTLETIGKLTPRQFYMLVDKIPTVRKLLGMDALSSPLGGGGRGGGVSNLGTFDAKHSNVAARNFDAGARLQ